MKLILLHYFLIFNPLCVCTISCRECLVSLPLLPWKIPRLIWEFFYTIQYYLWYYHSYNFVILGLSSRCRDAFSCPHCKAEGKLPLTITRMLLFKGLTSQIVTGGQQYNHSNSQKIPASQSHQWIYFDFL